MSISSLRTLFVLSFLFVAAVPLGFTGIVTLNTLTDNLEREITQRNEILAHSLAGEIDRFLQEPLRLLRQVTDQVDIKDTPDNVLNDYLDVVVSNYTFFERLEFIDRQGIVRNLAPYDEDFAGLDVSQQPFFRHPSSHSGQSWSATSLSPRTNRPTIMITMPYSKGIVAATLNLNAIENITGKVTIGKTGNAFVTDRDGTIIAHPDREIVAQRMNISSLPILKEGMAGRSGTFTYTFLGNSKLGSVAVVPSTKWVVIVSQTHDEAFAPVTRVRTLILSGIITSLFLTFLLGLFVARRTLAPLSKFAARIRMAARGDYDPIAPGKAYSEIKDLASSFNTMIEAIRQREEELKRSEERFKTLADASSEAIIIHDKGVILHANGRFYEEFGFTPEETIGQYMLDKITAPSALPKVLGSMHLDFGLRESTGMRADGKEFPVEYIAHNIEYGGREVRVSAIRDVTKRVHTERALRQAEQYLHLLIDSMDSLIIGVDPTLHITFWNRSTERQTGISKTQARGRSVSDIMPSILPHMDRVRRALAEGTPQFATRVPHFGIRGRYDDISIYPLSAEDITGAVIRIDDVTNRVRMEETMIQTEKMMSVGGLAAGMAHEINNPLGGILQGVQNIIRRVDPELPSNRQAAEETGCSLETLRAYLEKRNIPRTLEGIQEAGSRAARIVSNMLEFSRQSDAQMEPHDLTEIAERVIELAYSDYDMKKRYDFKKIEIVKEFEPDIPRVECMRTEIEQVFLNLLRNAAQAMAGGGPMQAAPRITIRIGQEENSVRIDVEDNGPGLPSSIRNRVFEPFFTTKPPGEGTGLGLSVSYFIITQNHGGKFTVDSEPGAGARFTIHLPLRYAQ